MRFANFYAPSPRCTRRGCLLHRKSPAQLHMTFINEGKGQRGWEYARASAVASMELPTSEPTLAKLLKQAGYATPTSANGTWRANPSQHGYDENDGANGNGGPTTWTIRTETTLRMTERGLDFMARQVKPANRSSSNSTLRLPERRRRRPETVAAVTKWAAT